MQIARFSNGGYVIHKMTGSWSGRISAWFDANGKLLDAKRIDHANRSYAVKVDGPIWMFIASKGLYYRDSK